MKKMIAAATAMLLTMGAAGNVLPCTNVFDTSISASAGTEAPALKKLNSLNELGVVGYDEIVASNNGYIATRKSGDSKDIYVIDTETDTCVATYETETNYDIVVGLTDDLTVMVYSDKTFSGEGYDRILFYNGDEKNFYAATNIDVSDKRFYLYKNTLFAVKSNSLYSVYDSGDDAFFESISLDDEFPDHSGTMIAKDYLYNALYAYYEIEDGDVYILVKNIYSGELVQKSMCIAPSEFSSMWGCFTKDYILLGFNSDSEPAEYINCYNIEDKSINRTITYDPNYNYYSSPKSPYIFMGLKLGKKSNDGYIRFYDPRNDSYTYIPVGRDDIIQAKASCMDENRWIVTIDYENGDTEFYLEDLTQTGSVPPLNIIKPELPEGQTEYTVGPGYEEARKLADEMEEKYGITIMFGNEIYNFDEDYITSFEPYVDDEFKESLVDNFKLLDQKLSKYPEGFFEKFKDEDGEGGLLLRYVHYTKNGVADSTTRDNWYVFTGCEDCVGGYALEHEMYHLVEALIGKTYPISEEDWNTLDPEDFERFEVWADDAEFPDMYLLGVGGPLAIVNDDPYFLTPYCMGAGWEDRAIMVGHIFDTEQYGIPFTGEYDTTYYETYSSYPHLKDKYDYIENMLKQYYGYNYWKYALGLTELPTIGDVSLDGQIDIDDAVDLVSYIVGNTPLNQGQMNYADVDGSGTVDIEDVVAVINHINGVKSLY